MNRFEQLNSRVVAWADSKGILEKATPLKQAEKTLEEAKELVSAVDFDSVVDIVDALGDVMVTILIQAKMQNLDLLDCLESALDIIEKRTGKMIDGQFVKDK